ncbi:MAG: low temperature requirement protein A [Acidimicrobiia bacterium]|nr:low temperature requirement protein A [Acidimicrobiia bacterium]
MGKVNPAAMVKRFRGRFWLPPRPHGEVIEDRTVSFLELFFDLVFVVLIARASHTLAHHLSWRGVADFAIVFGLIWLAWINGTTHHELHGREDGRSRTFIFIQMLLLALLAVFAGDATGEGGVGFATTYVGLQLVLTWLWYTVRRQDSQEYMAITARYLAGMIGSTLVMGVSIFLPSGARTTVWAIFVVGWLIGAMLQFRSSGTMGFSVTDSMIERFGLFTIIVLGEVVVGVVNGLSEVERTGSAIATGLLGLIVGFGIWWTYFDYIGRRFPGESRLDVARWVLGHLPISMSIAAGGAALVSLVEHAGEPAAPVAATWLLSGSVALGLLSMAQVMGSLRDFGRLPTLYRPVVRAMVAGAIGSLAVGIWRPTAWLVVLALAAIHSVIWFFAFDRWLRLEKADEASP